MSDIQDIQQILSVLSAAFPNFKMQKNTPDIYLELLQDIPADELKAAVLAACGEPGRAFAPSIGELRGQVLNVRQMISHTPTSYQAWEEVRRAMAEVGSYRRPSFSNPVIQRAVDALGWRNLCLSEDQTADRMRFIQAYEQLAARSGMEEMLPAQVKGYIESQQSPALDAGAQMRRLADGMRA